MLIRMLLHPRIETALPIGTDSDDYTSHKCLYTRVHTNVCTLVCARLKAHALSVTCLFARLRTCENVGSIHGACEPSKQ